MDPAYRMYRTGVSVVTVYKVHRSKLCASPVFRDMLQCDEDVKPSTDLPIIQLAEGSKVVDFLLDCVYNNMSRLPTCAKDLEGSVTALYEATIKYQLPMAQALMEAIVRWEASLRSCECQS